MATKRYAVYKLVKRKGKKEYEPTQAWICNSLKAGYHELDIWDEDLDGPVTFNRKTQELEAFELHDRMIYVPNQREDEDGWHLIGAYGRFPIYYLDVYPNPYSYYKLHKVRGDNRLELEGIV